MLDHPFGLKKKFLVKLLTEQELTPALTALFPEFKLMGKQTAPVRSALFTEGDQSRKLIDQAEADLKRLGYWQLAADGEPGFVIEEMSDSTRAAAFLAKHYFQHRMFEWFWIMYERLQSADDWELHQKAMEAAGFDRDRKSIADVREGLERCLSSSGVTAPKRQRLWTKWAVIQIYRQEYPGAEQALTESWGMLDLVEDVEERLCREAEWYNALAFLRFACKKEADAWQAMEQAEQRLAQSRAPARRVDRVRKILADNRQLLQQRMAGR